MQNFKQLKVWEKAHNLTLAIYKATSSFPKDERYSLTDQMRRSSSSIPTNIAEGSGRGSDADFARFVQMSMGSARELQYQLILSRDLNYLAAAQYLELESLLSEVQRMLTSLIKKLTAKS
jgi:four helix bundle protein